MFSHIAFPSDRRYTAQWLSGQRSSLKIEAEAEMQEQPDNVDAAFVRGATERMSGFLLDASYAAWFICRFGSNGDALGYRAFPNYIDLPPPLPPQPSGIVRGVPRRRQPQSRNVQAGHGQGEGSGDVIEEDTEEIDRLTPLLELFDLLSNAGCGAKVPLDPEPEPIDVRSWVRTGFPSTEQTA